MSKPKPITDCKPGDVRRVVTRKTSGWITLRYEPQEPRYRCTSTDLSQWDGESPVEDAR